jgi:hypothetical protein
MFTLSIALENRSSLKSILEIPQEYYVRLFCHTLTPGFFLHPFHPDILFGVLCRRLQACQLPVVDGMIGVHRRFYHFFTYCPLLLLGLPLPSAAIQNF